MSSTRPLRIALRLNAAFSTFSAAVLLFAHDALGDTMGVDPRLLTGVAIGLAAFAGHLVFTAARRDVAKLRAESLRHSMADLGWVVGSLAVIAGGWITPTGNALLAAVAVPVLALGIAQLRSLPAKPGEAVAIAS